MASKKMIKIISISKDRQSCIDNNGNISVCIAYNKNKNLKYIKY